MHRKAFVSALIALWICTPLVAKGAAELGWLQGHWQSQREGAWVEEHWLTPRDGLIVGLNRSGNGSGRVSFEFLRIQNDSDGILTYWAAPGGRSAVPFELEQMSDSAVSFVNTEHDYPQKIHYQREGDTLTATISAADGSNPMTFVWRRADPG